MQKIKFKCDTRNYDKWDLYDSTSFNLLDKEKYDVDPLRDKLFNQDIILYDESNPIKILHSSNREMPIIPGILLLNENKRGFLQK